MSLFLNLLFETDSYSNEYLLAKFSFDTAENEPWKVCPLSAYRSPRSIGNYLKASEGAAAALELAERVFASEGELGFRRLRILLKDIILLCLESFAAANHAEFAKAEKLAERALGSAERMYGKDHENIAYVLREYSRVLDLTDKAKAREMLTRALMITDRVYGKDHHKAASVLLVLGDTYRFGDTNDREKAREVFERALTILEHAFGRDHEEVYAALSKLGSTG